MADVFIATLGQRPAAITVALDKLGAQYTFAEAVILHTDAYRSGIADALASLRKVMRSDYPDLYVTWHPVTDDGDVPLLDISDERSSTAYYRGVLKALLEHQRRGQTLHLLVAGGRKAMSIYATLAATLVFGPRDRLWTVLSPELMLRDPGQFHIPPGLRDQVQVIDLPLLPSRLSPSERAQLDDPMQFVANRRNPREALLASLSPQERRLALLLEQHPYATNEELADMLDKHVRTIENQFRGIYHKLGAFSDQADSTTRKRQILLDVLAGRV
jgi:CRISPR-associated protein Csx14